MPQSILMKQIVFCFLILVFTSCTKEKKSAVPSGTYTIIETSAGTGYGIVQTNYQPGTGTDINFGTNGIFTVSDATSPLSSFNRYEINGNLIRFYHSLSGEEMKAAYDIGTRLSLNYELARCGYKEIFIPR